MLNREARPAPREIGSHVTAQLWNWSGTYQFTARQVVSARTVEEVRRAVTAGGRIRALGTRHTFNDLADNGATLVSVTGLAPDPVIDEAAGTVAVGAGTSYGALAAWLQHRGWALHNLGSLPHISVAGATATGTHGSGSGNRVLSAAIAGLEYVAADGGLRRADRSSPGFDAMAVGLGAFGIVVRVTLDIEPAYLVRQDAYSGLTWDRLLADVDGVLGAAYSVSLFTDWSGQSLRAAWVKRRVADAGAAVPDEFFGARRDSGPVRFIDAPDDNLTVVGVAGPWSQRLPHFRLDSTPSNGEEIQSEYFVDRRDGAAALAALRRLAPRLAPLLLVSEIRSTAPDGLWLSGSYGRPTMAIHFTWRNRPAEVDAAVRDVEAALEPFAARPHWGKVSHVTKARVTELYPRLGDARDLFERLDPDGRFSNRRLERLGVRAPADRPLPARAGGRPGDQARRGFTVAAGGIRSPGGARGRPVGIPAGQAVLGAGGPRPRRGGRPPVTRRRGATRPPNRATWLRQACAMRPSWRSAVTPSSRPISCVIRPFSTFKTVMPVNRNTLPVPAGSAPSGMSSNGAPACVPPPSHWPTT